MTQSYLSSEIISKSDEPCLAKRILSGIAMIYIEDKANKSFIRLAITGDIIVLNQFIRMVSKLKVSDKSSAIPLWDGEPLMEYNK